MHKRLDRPQRNSSLDDHLQCPKHRASDTLRSLSILSFIILSATNFTVINTVYGQTTPNDPTSHSEIKPDRSDSSSTSLESNRLTQHLWQSQIAPPDPNEDLETRQSIEELIRKIRSVKFDDTTPKPTFTSPPAQLASQSDPNMMKLVVANTVEATAPTAAVPMSTTTPQAALPENTLKKLEELVKNPNQVSNPLEVAELLFLSGRLVNAGVFYKQALDLMPPENTGTNNDRAWALFQLGNCLRETDIAKAKEMYMKLIADYPASPWTELAKAHGRLITWYQSANPKQWISQEESP